MSHLTIQTGPAKGRTFELTGKPQSLGREGDIQVLDTAASRKHAEIFAIGGMFIIKDLNSRNGTFVNDGKITKETPLRIGDRVRIGSSLLLFEKKPSREHAVEFVPDAPEEVATSSTVEIKLGERSAHVVTGPDRLRDESAMRRLFVMYEVARVLGRETTLQGVIDKVLDLAMSSVGPSYCYVFLRDEGTGNLVPRTWRDQTQGKRRKISRSIVTRAMHLRHSILTADAVADERFSQSDSVVVGEVRSVICAPLIARDHINGVLYMGRDAVAKPFVDPDLELATAVALQAGIALENVMTHNERKTDLQLLVKTLVGAMDLRQRELRGHSERVAAYAAAITEQLRLSPEESEEVLLAALLHDVGKVTVTEETRLAVSSALGQSVQAQYCHAFLGARLLEDLPALVHIIPGVKYHHERLDGFGGPEGRSGEAIPLVARIVATANRFDHLATDLLATGRPMSVTEALETISQPGEGLDDAVTHALIEAQTTGSGIQLPRLVLQEFC